MDSGIVMIQDSILVCSPDPRIPHTADAATMILWTKLFLEAQGYNVEKNSVYQDNKSAILLETNGKKSSGKQMRALNIRYFFIANQVEKGNAQIDHSGTDNMTRITQT
jgi:hypothetical protein